MKMNILVKLLIIVVLANSISKKHKRKNAKEH